MTNSNKEAVQSGENDGLSLDAISNFYSKEYIDSLHAGQHVKAYMCRLLMALHTPDNYEYGIEFHDCAHLAHLAGFTYSQCRQILDGLRRFKLIEYVVVEKPVNHNISALSIKAVRP